MTRIVHGPPLPLESSADLAEGCPLAEASTRVFDLAAPRHVQLVLLARARSISAELATSAATTKASTQLKATTEAGTRSSLSAGTATSARSNRSPGGGYSHHALAIGRTDVYVYGGRRLLSVPRMS